MKAVRNARLEYSIFPDLDDIPEEDEPVKPQNPGQTGPDVPASLSDLLPPGEPPMPIPEPLVLVLGFAPPSMLSGTSSTTPTVYLREMFDPTTGGMIGHQTLQREMTEEEVAASLTEPAPGVAGS